MVTRPGETIAAHANNTNADAVITIAGEVGKRRHLSKITFAYSAAPTNGRVSVTVDGVTKFSAAVTSAGPGPLNVNIPGEVNAPIVVTLAGGGSGVRGDLNVEYHKGNG